MAYQPRPIDTEAVKLPPEVLELTEQLAEKTFTEQAKGILKQLLAGQRPEYRISQESCTSALGPCSAASLSRALPFNVCWMKPVMNWPVTTCSTPRGS